MRFKLLGTLLAGLVCVSLGSADLVSPRKSERELLVQGMGTRTFTNAFKANERALAAVFGNGDSSCLGLYVFDAQGNCVAHDDGTQTQTCDDLGVEWVPPAEARYSVEVRNAGILSNAFQLVLR